MNRKLLSLFSCAIIFALGCAPYKQLKPKLDISPTEAGYQELKKEKTNFKLAKNNKYYIQFPGAQDDNFFLILRPSPKNLFTSFFTGSYVKNVVGTKINDQSTLKDSLIVYPVNKLATGYFWMIEGLTQEVDIKLDYRYVPQWRYTFENKYATLKKTVADNLVDRSTMAAIGTTIHMDGFNFRMAIDTVKKHTGELAGAYKTLLDIESLFPKNLLNSTDPAYLNYKELRLALDSEMKFQSGYSKVLNFFNTMNVLQGNTPGLLGYTDSLIAYFTTPNLPAPIFDESKKALSKRLDEILPYYEKKLADKPTAAALDPKDYYLPQLKKLPALYDAARISFPPEMIQLNRFIDAFNAAAPFIKAADDTLASIKKTVTDLSTMPSNDFFPAISKRLSSLKTASPQPLNTSSGKYLEYSCSKQLNTEIARVNAAIDPRLSESQQAERIVPQANVYLAQSQYKGLLEFLVPNKQFDFLMSKYRKADTLSIAEQDGKIRTALAENRWSDGETALKGLFSDENFLYPQNVMPLKMKALDTDEDLLYTSIDQFSRARILKFGEEKVGQFENIDSIYMDSVFLPAYNITFASGSKNELYKKKADLTAHLALMKENEFPARAMNLLYDQFVKDPNDNGVLRARAIVKHSEHYKGKDDKLKRKVAEVNPLSAKWIVEPKEYRRLNVMPITDKRKGTNTYMFRINIKIPTEAQFPVYDVNIKLPKEVAQNAGQSQWYEKMSINGKILKNEGRFVITAPSAENDYECQISPMSVDKEGNNVLEVTFNHASFKVFPVSIMVQKPLIKKN